MEEHQTIQEIWALPTEMKILPFKFQGIDLYTSDKLKLKFFEAVLATQWGKYHSKNIQRLLSRNFVVPCFMNKNILSYLAKKFTSDWSKDIQGVYSGELEKVLIFIDNNSNWLGLSSNKKLVKTTLHELMHLSASKNMAGFYKILKPTFEKYYSEYFKHIFSCEKINVEKILKNLYKLEGIFSSQLHKNYMQEVEYATEHETKLDATEYENIFKDLFFITKVFPLNPQLVMRYYSRYYHMFGPLNSTYMKVFGERNRYTSPVQELWALSEVAAVMVELLPVDRRVSAVLSNIK